MGHWEAMSQVRGRGVRGRWISSGSAGLGQCPVVGVCVCASFAAPSLYDWWLVSITSRRCEIVVVAIPVAVVTATPPIPSILCAGRRGKEREGR